MAGETPGRVPVYTALKLIPSRHELQLRRPPQFSASLDSMPCRHNNGHVTTVRELHLCKHHLDGHVTAQIHLPLLTATLALQLEPGKEVVVSANYVVAAEPAIQHANTQRLVILEIIDSEFSSHRPHAVPNEIVSTIRSENSTTRRHRNANTPAEHWAAESRQYAYVEHAVTTDAVATMVQPTKRTVNDTKVGSATGAVNTNVPVYFPLETLSAKSIHIPKPSSDGRHNSKMVCFVSNT